MARKRVLAVENAKLSRRSEHVEDDFIHGFVAPKSLALTTKERATRDVQLDHRVRTDKEPLENELFQLFEEKQFWTLSDINNEVQQPVVWLKQVLAGIATYHRKGEYRGYHELKPEFRNTALAAAEDDAELEALEAEEEEEEAVSDDAMMF